MAHVPLPLAPVRRRFGQTKRRDAWWVQSAVTFLVLAAFVVYVTWAAFQGTHYAYGHYLSPLYSPLLYGDPAHAWFGLRPGWWPDALPFSAALLILWAPGGFRFTCYYYRGAYYKAFWADPPACAVGEPRKRYRGERRFPLVLQNVHRYFLYLAVVFIVILAWDVVKATRFTDPLTGRTSFGIGVGTLVLAVNVLLLGGYLLGCHSLRHVVGGHLDQIARRPVRRVAYDCASCLNRAHMRWAWASLVSVAFADLYVRLCATGVWHDWRIL
jgi:hypothetical protein